MISRRSEFFIFVFIGFFLFSFVLSTFGIVTSDAFAGKKNVRLATSKAGTAGYASGVGLSACVNTYAKDVRMETVATPGSTASARMFGKKNVDFAYLSTWGLAELYQEMGPFAKEVPKRKPYQGFYYLSAEWMVLTKYNRKDINSYHDLAGKKVFPGKASWGWHDGYREVFKYMDIWDKIQQRQVGPMEAADALQMGTIDAVGGYSINRGDSAVGWIRNIDSRINIKVVSPTPKEQKQIKELNLPGVYVGAKLSKGWMSSTNQKHNTQDVWLWGAYQGFHPGSDLSTEAMYQIYKAWIEHADSDLAAVNSFLRYYAKNPLEMQIAAIDAAKVIPVHPGVAKYLKEKGLWREIWTVGKLDPGVD